MTGGLVRITRKSVPPKGHSVVQYKTQEKSSLTDKVELLKAEILYLTVNSCDDDDNNNNNVL